MGTESWTQVSEFILLGFTDHPDLETSLFFLQLYLLILVGDIAMILLINIDSTLQLPKDVFLRGLSFFDAC